MTESAQDITQNLLINRPLPESLLAEQISEFTHENLRAKPVVTFNSQLALATLKQKKGHRALAIDMGGDKIAASVFEVNEDGSLTSVTQKSFQSSHGDGYLQFLEEIKNDEDYRNVPVGISYAGPIEDSIPLAGPNVQTFMDELRAKYDGDFNKLFPNSKAVNDAASGMFAAAVETRRKYPGIGQVIYIINGSGFGGAVLKDNQMIATEPGHIKVSDDLNTHGQDRPCGVFGATYICVESVAASKAGVEDLWRKLNDGEILNGRQIKDKYLEGNKLAGDLYDNSAFVTAHAIKGIAECFDLLKQPNDTAVVCHGGIFYVDGYGKRVQNILQKDLGFVPVIMLTSDFSPNACIDGAAIAALV